MLCRQRPVLFFFFSCGHCAQDKAKRRYFDLHMGLVSSGLFVVLPKEEAICTS